MSQDEQSVERRDQQLLGRRRGDHSDGQVQWLAEHFTNIIESEFAGFKIDLASTVEKILARTVSGLLHEHLEEYHSPWREARLVLSCVAASITTCCVLFFIGKLYGWWV